MKEEQKSKPTKSSSPEEEIKTSRPGWKMFFKKKWFFPAVYLASAALILALITWYQNPNDFTMDQEDLGYDTINYDSATDKGVDQSYEDPSLDDAVPVTTAAEEMKWPVAQNEEIQVVIGYFDDDNPDEENAEAMVEYNRSFHPSQGISLSRQDGETFNVIAALSGKVVLADKDPLVGYFVEIEHENGLVTVYQSLEDLQVTEGVDVKQGEILGQAGRNVFRQGQGIHVYFEVRDNGKPVNPDQYLNQSQPEEQ